MPYGLNHRKSLEDLVPSGNLRIFSPIQNYATSKCSPGKSKFSNEKIGNTNAGAHTYFTCKTSFNYFYSSTKPKHDK